MGTGKDRPRARESLGGRQGDARGHEAEKALWTRRRKCCRRFLACAVGTRRPTFVSRLTRLSLPQGDWKSIIKAWTSAASHPTRASHSTPDLRSNCPHPASNLSQPPSVPLASLAPGLRFVILILPIVCLVTELEGPPALSIADGHIIDSISLADPPPNIACSSTTRRPRGAGTCARSRADPRIDHRIAHPERGRAEKSSGRPEQHVRVP